MFEWDEQKAELNQLKHSVSFLFITRAFDDKNRVTIIDYRFDTPRPKSAGILKRCKSLKG